MAQNRPLLDFISKAIEQAQQQNRDNPNEETAHGSVFDLIKDKVQNAPRGNQQYNQQGNNQPRSIIDFIKQKVDEAKNQNQNDPNVKTAPGSIFDMIKNQVDNFQNQTGQDAFRNLVDEFNLDLTGLNKEAQHQIHRSFMKDRQNLRSAYVQKIREVTQR